MTERSDRLVAFIERAQRASGLSWRQAQARGGPAYETFREMRTKGATARGTTLRNYERGFGLPAGILDRVIDGDDSVWSELPYGEDEREQIYQTARDAMRDDLGREPTETEVNGWLLRAMMEKLGRERP